FESPEQVDDILDRTEDAIAWLVSRRGGEGDEFHAKAARLQRRVASCTGRAITHSRPSVLILGYRIGSLSIVPAGRNASHESSHLASVVLADQGSDSAPHCLLARSHRRSGL